jgi:hypothetical protein
LIVTSAPNASAWTRRASARSIADHAAGRQQARGHDRREPDRAGSDHGDCVAGLHIAVQDSDLERRREDVGEEQHLLVAQLLGNRVHGRVREGHTRVLRLQPVDQVPEDPAASARAEAVVALAAEPAAPAGRDAGDEDAVALGDRRDRVALGHDRADGLVPEDPARLDGRDVALEDVEVGSADGRGADLDHDVGGLPDRRVGNGLPRPDTGTSIGECLHDGTSFRLLGLSLTAVTPAGIGGRHDRECVIPRSRATRAGPAG